MSTYGMLPVILRPTRVSTHSASLIDNIFISICNDFTTSGVITSLISDHFAVFRFQSVGEQRTVVAM